MAIYMTGDTHGEFTRFKKDIFYEQAELTKDDYVIICGDFGGVWDGSPTDRYWLNWLEEKPFTALFVSGNHENFDLLSEYAVEDWHGGKVQRIQPSVIHLMRGQVYEIEGKTFFTMGGGSSHDVADGILEPDDPLFKQKRKSLDAHRALYRVNHQSWWKEELPSNEEYETAKANLDRYNWQVDYIISHCCPTSIQDALSGGAYQADRLTAFFQEVSQRCQFNCWFCGHYHLNALLEQRYVLLYEQIIQLKV